MGRNAACKVSYSHVSNSGVHVGTWYCQQHGQWDQTQAGTPNESLGSCLVHIFTPHGNVEQ